MIDREQAIEAVAELLRDHARRREDRLSVAAPEIVDAILALPDPVHEAARQALAWFEFEGGTSARKVTDDLRAALNGDKR